MTRQPSLAAISAKNGLIHARAERDAHSEECPHWDYEGNDCEECDRLLKNMQAAMRRWDAFYGKGIK